MGRGHPPFAISQTRPGVLPLAQAQLLTPLRLPAYVWTMTWLPLQVPPQWPDIRRRSLLLGIPLIGPQAGAYDHICQQLALRTADCWALWGPNEARVQAAQFVARTVGEEVEWPNPIFIPDDPFELVFWDHKSCAVDDLSLVGAFMTIESHFGASPSDEDLDRFQEGTFGAYVDFLLQASRPCPPASDS